jgi:isochorismate hydrolase
MPKEPYFTPETIHVKAQEMLASLSEYRRRHENIIFHPARAALLVLDMQEYFLDPASHAFIPSAPAIIPNIQALIAAFHENNRPVIFTRHVNTDEDAGMMGKWWKDLIRPESAASRLTAALDSGKGKVISKNQYDAFQGTTLESDLRAGGVGELVITGVMTHLCCETTARSAFVRGFEVFFTIDGTAAYTEAFHRAALLNLAHGFALPLLTGELLAAWGGREIHA